MRMPPASNRIITFSFLSLILACVLLASSSVAYADTAVMSGTIYSGADITETVHVNVNSLNANQPGAQLTYNAPIPTSTIVSGYSESVSNWNIVVSPTPNGMADMTDQFGNPYRQFTWNLSLSNGSSLAITSTTTFHADITGEATPVNYNDPLGTSAMSQFLSSTTLVQSNDPSIKAKATQLVNGATGEADAVDRIINFVKTNMPNQALSSSHEDAVWSLTSSTGNCVNRANLAMALMRSSGIPCRYVSGYVYGDNIVVTYSSGGGQATGTLHWDSGPHTWVEVYYPAEGVWVPYDPFMDKGFIDSRHVKTQVSLDDDTSSPNYRNTHGDSGLFNVVSVNPEVTVSMSSAISVANLQDNNQLQQYGSTQSAPQGGLMIARSLQSTATATPAASPSASATSTVTVTPSPSANVSVTPIPANATVSPVARINSSTATPTALPVSGTPGDNGTYFKLSGIVISALTEKPVQGATVVCGVETMKTGDNGAFAFFEPNGTVTLDVSADGYLPYNSTIITSGQDRNVRVELTSVPSASASASPKGSFPIPGPTILITIAIFTGSAALLWRARDR